MAHELLLYRSVAGSSPIICKTSAFLSGFTYKRGMSALDRYLDEQLSTRPGLFQRAGASCSSGQIHEAAGPLSQTTVGIVNRTLR